MGRSRRTTSIHVLDDDSLLHVFYLYRLFLLGEDEKDNARLIGGWKQWVCERWWYTLTHVCKRWRDVILRSASHLGLSLVCTYGTPVADMLALSPLLPLVVDYSGKPGNNRDLTTEDEEGIIFALKQHDRVLRVRLSPPVSSLRKFIAVMDEEYPVLEHLIIVFEDNSTTLMFPESFQAPHLHNLRLQGLALPIGPRLLANAEGLVVLSLVMLHPSTYFDPNTLLQWISLMSQLETLAIYFQFSIPNHNVQKQLTHTSRHTSIITLPNLQHFHFHGVSNYLEALVHRITTPQLKDLRIGFSNQLTFSIPCLLQLIAAAENFRSSNAVLAFSDKRVIAGVYPPGPNLCPFSISVYCWHLDWQVSSIAQIFNLLSQMLSAVEFLVLQHDVHTKSSEEHDEVDRTEWRKLLKPFVNVKTLRIEKGLIKDFTCCFQLEDGEPPLELLPELHELEYSGSDDTGDAFTSFIDARRNAGLPVTLVRL